MLINHFLLICVVILTPIALLFGLIRLATQDAFRRLAMHKKYCVTSFSHAK
jgi:hypothetical protein